MRRPHALAPLVLVAVLAMAGCENQILERIVQDVQAAKAAGAPAVTQTNPEDAQENVATDTPIWATFSVPVDATTVTESSFLLTKATVAVEGTVTYDAKLNRAVFTPTEALELTTTYTATLTTDIENVDGIAMAAEYGWKFTTYAANPDEIVVNLSYVGPYELSATYPIFLRFYPDPLVIVDPEVPIADLLLAIRLDGPGSAVASVDDLPASDSGAWAMEVLHDLDGNYETLGGSSGVDVSAWYVDNDGTNLTTDEMEVLVTFYPDPATFTPEAHLEPGNAYAVEYEDPPAVEADSAEPDDDWSTAKAVELFGSATRTHDWGNPDWFSFEPPREDRYRIVAARDPYNPDDITALDVDFDVYLQAFVYDPAHDDIFHVGTDDDGSYGLLDLDLNAGYTYYLEVTGMEAYDVGEYKLKIIYAEAEPDAYEPDDEPADATPIPLGSAGMQLHTARKFDYDFLDFLLPETGGLSNNVAYAFLVTKPEESARDLSFRVTLSNEEQTIGCGDILAAPFPVTLLSAPLNHVDFSAGDHVYIRVANESPDTDYFRPTGEYEITVRVGPDGQDYDVHSGANNLPPLEAVQRDDAWNTAPTPVGVGSGVQMKSIWPAGDVDWLVVYWDDGTYPTGLRFTVTGPTEGADDIKVQMRFYDEEDDVLSASGDYHDFTAASTYDIGPGLYTLAGNVYVEVWKSDSEGAKNTGAYTAEVTAVP